MVDFALLRDRLILGPCMAVTIGEFIYATKWLNTKFSTSRVCE